MVDERELLPLIDACRADQSGLPNPADLAAAVDADPSLRPLAELLVADRHAQDLFARAKRFERRVSAAMSDVPVPAGLADRILKQLELAGAQTALEPVELPSPADSSHGAELRPSLGERIWSRRYWLAGGLATAAAALLVVNWYGSAVHYSPEMVLSAVGQFDAAAVAGESFALSDKQPPQGFPRSKRIVPAGEVRWRPVAQILGRKGVAYDLHTPGGATATLYVVRLGGLPNAPQIEAARLPTAPPANPQPASGGASMAAWQESGRLYVLVVHGDARAYRQLIAPAPVIAWHVVHAPRVAS